MFSFSENFIRKTFTMEAIRKWLLLSAVIQLFTGLLASAALIIIAVLEFRPVDILFSLFGVATIIAVALFFVVVADTISPIWGEVDEEEETFE